MATIVSNARVFQKNGLEENWNKVTDYIPGKGEIIIYNADEDHEYPRLKVGDGVSLPKDLPFAMAGGTGGDIDLSNITAARVAHKLRFGTEGIHEFDGSEDVTIPTYSGSYLIH